jgi:NADPH:quinone reductase-like Zn-dependent oxidoreductase
MPRVVRFHQTGGPEVLKIETIDVPPPAAGEVRIAVKALGLNRAESMFRLGQYLEDPTFPAPLGYEAAGIVEAVGPGVNRLKAGDEVFGPDRLPQPDRSASLRRRPSSRRSGASPASAIPSISTASISNGMPAAASISSPSPARSPT